MDSIDKTWINKKRRDKTWINKTWSDETWINKTCSDETWIIYGSVTLRRRGCGIIENAEE